MQQACRLTLHPCVFTWQIVTINETMSQGDAVQAVAAAVGGRADDVWIPYVVSSGDIVGPGQVAYVGPCQAYCCGGPQRVIPPPLDSEFCIAC